jgi:hypothetical protein
MTHQEGSVGAVPARSADNRSQSSLIARLSQEEVRATTAEAENTWPWATLQQRRYHTARQNRRRRWVHSSAPASPPPESHTVWSPASRTRTSSGGTLPATSRAHTPRSQATAGLYTRVRTYTTTASPYIHADYVAGLYSKPAICSAAVLPCPRLSRPHPCPACPGPCPHPWPPCLPRCLS